MLEVKTDSPSALGRNIMSWWRPKGSYFMLLQTVGYSLIFKKRLQFFDSWQSPAILTWNTELLNSLIQLEFAFYDALPIQFGDRISHIGIRFLWIIRHGSLSCNLLRNKVNQPFIHFYQSHFRFFIGRIGCSVFQSWCVAHNTEGV